MAVDHIANYQFAHPFFLNCGDQMQKGPQYSCVKCFQLEYVIIITHLSSRQFCYIKSMLIKVGFWVIYDLLI